ncbi:hypothetical protein STRIP9103_08674 [Streptomyces ipomoeae 91-03]|uniref:Uncharacterized protein n=1 Tax=Streptomyces ipomoeae 91-03 TaxID=698759 RepID=L1KPR4_9ACTN|nr:hypothetical protein STRIP9103_08674 [Streptomyces ipomoeae 91-03]
MLRSTSATLLDIKISRDRRRLDRGPGMGVGCRVRRWMSLAPATHESSVQAVVWRVRVVCGCSRPRGGTAHPHSPAPLKSRGCAPLFRGPQGRVSQGRGAVSMCGGGGIG